MSALLKKDILTDLQPTPGLQAIPPAFGIGIYARVLRPQDSTALRAIRLEALKYDGRCFASAYDKEQAAPQDYWHQLCTEAKDHCIIGLFDENDLIGITSISKWPGDMNGQTALFGSSYIRPDYRGQGLATLLYGGRIEWTVKHSRFKSAVVFHRNGNVISEIINKKHGAVYWEKKPMQWADGQDAEGFWYQIKLSA